MSFLVDCFCVLKSVLLDFVLVVRRCFLALVSLVVLLVSGEFWFRFSDDVVVWVHNVGFERFYERARYFINYFLTIS